MSRRNPTPSGGKLLVATERPAVYAFFSEPAVCGPGTTAARIDVSAAAVPGGEVGAAVVDAGLDAQAAVELCEELQRRQPGLPTTAIVCCQHSVTPWSLRALIAAGAGSILDLRATPDEARRALAAAARGDAMLQLRLGAGLRRPLREILTSRPERPETQAELLQLVAHGLPDHEIGRRLHLSPHTVKKHIEQLRDEVGARNRIELAAWAGRHGLYGDGRATA